MTSEQISRQLKPFQKSQKTRKFLNNEPNFWSNNFSFNNNHDQIKECISKRRKNKMHPEETEEPPNIPMATLLKNKSIFF